MGARSSPDESLLGRVIDERYRIDTFVGQGGYGIVCQGMQLSVDRRVAIKLLLPEHANDNEMQQRFAREARLASRIRNRHVVQLLDFGLAGAVPYIIMEWLEGPTLKQFQRASGRLPWPIAAMIARDIAEGLSDAHELGLAHRDLKPSNILLTIARDAVQPVIVDFGLAKAFLKEEHSDDDTLTSANMMLGTPAYMAPETVAGDELDGRGDIYALGILLCEMISGRLPFRGRTQMETATQHLVGKRPDARFFKDTDTPEDLIALVISMLDREPASRPASAAHVASMLDVFAQETTSEQLKNLYNTVTRCIADSQSASSARSDAAAGDAPAKAVALDSDRRARLTTLFDVRPHTGDPLDAPDLSARDDATTSRIVRDRGQEAPSGAHRTVAPRAALESVRGTDSHGEKHAGLRKLTERSPSISDEKTSADRASDKLIGTRLRLVMTLGVTLFIVAIAGAFVVWTQLETSAEVRDDEFASPFGSAPDESVVESDSISTAEETVDLEHQRVHEPNADDGVVGGAIAVNDAVEEAAAATARRPEGRTPGASTGRHDPATARDAELHAVELGTAAASSSRRDEQASVVDVRSAPLPRSADAAPAERANAPQSAQRQNVENTEPAPIANPATASQPETADATEGAAASANPDHTPTVTPSNDEAPIATLTIQSRPWAEIFIDGESVGSHSIYRWQPPKRGRYVIRAVHGADSRERQVAIDGSEGRTVRFMFVQ